MMVNWKKMRIFIKPGVTDMRKAINGLSKIIYEETDMDVFSGYLFLFCSRNRKRLKILYWDKTGFCLWLKRLETDKFPWPRNNNEVKEISRKQLSMLLSGIDFFNKHKQLNYKEL